MNSNLKVCINCNRSVKNVITYSRPIDYRDYVICLSCHTEIEVALSRSTPESRALYFELKKINVPSILEFNDGHKTVDIAVTHKKQPILYIEVDGSHHALASKQAFADLKRDSYSLLDQGVVTKRIPNILIQEKLDETTQQLKDLYQQLLVQLTRPGEQDDENDEGYCIGCGEQIEYNPDYPYCIDCYKDWKKYSDGDEDEPEDFCHDCGREKVGKTSFGRPLCKKCYYGDN